MTSQIGDAVTAAGRLPAGVASQVRAVADSAFVSGVRLGSWVDVAVLVVAIAAVARYIPSSRPERLGGSRPFATPEPTSPPH